jgi:hypothetical protein
MTAIVGAVSLAIGPPLHIAQLSPEPLDVGTRHLTGRR